MMEWNRTHLFEEFVHIENIVMVVFLQRMTAGKSWTDLHILIPCVEEEILLDVSTQEECGIQLIWNTSVLTN